MTKAIDKEMTGVESLRWVPVFNASGEVIPPYAVMEISGANGGVLTVVKPTGNNPAITLVNGQIEISVPQTVNGTIYGGYGEGTFDGPLYTLYDSGSGTPTLSATTPWGPTSGSWKLTSGQNGFIPFGDAATGQYSGSVDGTGFFGRVNADSVTSSSSFTTMSLVSKVCAVKDASTGYVIDITEERYSIMIPTSRILSGPTCDTSPTDCCVTPITTGCCSNTLNSVLHAIIHSSGGSPCPCVDGVTTTLTYDSGTQKWGGTFNLPSCSQTLGLTIWCAAKDGGGFEWKAQFSSCATADVSTLITTPVPCNPFQLTIHNAGNSACCGGSFGLFDIVVTE